LAFQLEMIFTQKGSSNTNLDNPNFTDIASIHLDYIEVPLLMIYKQSESIELEIGIHSSALINGYYHDIYGELENQTGFNNFDIGALIGMSYKINNKLSLNTRLTNSIIPIAEHASGQTYRFNKGKYNTGLNFTLKYQL
ncbi:MAG: outer membrane beta-barrel protein, partial [Flavobacteriales bacterium]|nr:outer membrane beta-barrel protein [Flavobacteriales bacterium]